MSRRNQARPSRRGPASPIATACCDRHADGSNRPALIYVDEDGSARRFSFDELRGLSCRFANVMKAHGLVRGDRVAVFLSQSPELPIAHLAAFRAGLISVPLFSLFGEDALQFRLAEMTMQLESARTFLWRAAMALETGQPDATRLCAMAKCLATDAGFAVR